MTLDNLAFNLSAIMPINIVIAWACALLVVDLVIPKERKGWTALLAALGLVVAMGFAIAQTGSETVAFNGMVVVDGFAVFLTLLFLGSGLVGIALAYDYLKEMGIDRGEYYVLLMFSLSGMILMALAADLIVVFLALELLSIPLYVLAGFARPRQDSEEAAIKYFMLGAFSSGFVVYGVALVFGATGSTALAEIVKALNAGSTDLSLLGIGAGLILIGLGFKIAAVPFHMWTPDVYQGAPSAVTAFMAVGAKAGGFAALVRIFVSALPALAADFTPVLWGIAALTMLLGNVVAIAQGNIKRMLAYSSIAHAGYILMALVPFGQEDVAGDAVAAALFYLLAYAFTNFAAWAVVIAMEKAEGRGLALSDYAGMGRKYPALAAIMMVAMLS
ncbi:MAG TPA: NADH-quinone oxidoreductase subunit N, partial [Anaerolineales bacterium]|nr:NADH-quinone oxidoreductase subunit N [Anaerolineales bacterium]